MPRGRKCKLVDGRLKTMCEGMKGVVQDQHTRGTRMQGVSILNLFNMETMKPSRQLVVLKSGDHGKKGLVMNVCPFCTAVVYRPPSKRAA